VRTAACGLCGAVAAGPGDGRESMDQDRSTDDGPGISRYGGTRRNTWRLASDHRPAQLRCPDPRG